MRISVLTIGAVASIITTAAFANQVITSQTYVDNQDALKVNIAQGVGTNNANVGKTLVVNQQGNLELGTVSASNFVEDSITDGVTDKAPSENSVHDALADKQDVIAGKTNSFYPDSVITDTVTDGTVAKRVIIYGDPQNAWFVHQNALGSALASGNLIGSEFISDMASYYGYTNTDEEKALLSAGVINDAFGKIHSYKQNKMTCTRWIDNAEHTDANCLLWNMAN